MFTKAELSAHRGQCFAAAQDREGVQLLGSAPKEIAEYAATYLSLTISGISSDECVCDRGGRQEMTARGPASIYVYSGDIAKIAAAVDAYQDEVDTTGQVIGLRDVNWLDYKAMVAADPSANWEAFLSADCEAASMYVAHCPELGLGFASHVDSEVMVSVELAMEGPDVVRESSVVPWLERLRALEQANNQVRPDPSQWQRICGSGPPVPIPNSSTQHDQKSPTPYRSFWVVIVHRLLIVRAALGGLRGSADDGRAVSVGSDRHVR